MSAGLSACGSLGSDSSSGGADLWGSAFGRSEKSIAEAEANAAINKLLEGTPGLVLETSDRRVAAEAQKQALATPGAGGAVRWDNPRTGRQGEVRPGPKYQVNNTECREFTHQVTSKDNPVPVVARATACTDEKGLWRPIG
ncbi:MAG: lipoprotein LipA [Polymorphum sp.]|uniref:RT0821/Lpp0805 family surface protein n=1 Tax=Pannonibacter phragmitetus TaxID=121719 RepID=UPI0009E2610B|nr:RT0821/Lpp0805 family surface protein [Pannonibacter phragmitetus]MBA4203355.1 lipoprotein LipA [Polymorphum sp.]